MPTSHLSIALEFVQIMSFNGSIVKFAATPAQQISVVMFSLHDFILTGFKFAIGKVAHNKTILSEAARREKGVLIFDDQALLT